MSKLFNDRIRRGIADSDKKAIGTFVGHVVADMNQPRFKITADCVYAWDNGAAPFIQLMDALGFDGDSYWNHEYAGPRVSLDQRLSVTELHDEQMERSMGTISTEAPVSGRLEQLLGESGYCFRPGYIAMAQGNSSGSSVSIVELLRTISESGVELTFGRLDDARVEIILPIVGDVDRSDDDAEVAIVLRSDQMYAIEAVSYYVVAQGLRIVNAQFSLRNVQLNKGIWFPEEITWMSPPNSSGTRIKITNAAARDEVKSADFQIQFADGIRINDHRNKSSYVATKGPRDEALAVREFAATFLGDLDGLRQYQTEKKTAGQSFRIWLILLGGIPVGALLLFFFVRHRRTHVVLCLSFFLNLAGARAGEVPVAESKSDLNSPFVWNAERGWILKTPFSDGCINAVSQCGQAVTMFTLEAFDRSYDPMQLSRYLKPDSTGIGLDLIYNALCSRQLDVDARKNVSWSRLFESVSTNVVCIVAIPARDSAPAHYVCLLRRSDGDLLIIDHPHGSKSFSMDRRLQKSDIADLCVLLVSNSPNRPQAALEVPKSIQLMPDKTDCLAPVDISFEIANRGSQPIRRLHSAPATPLYQRRFPNSTQP